MCLDTCSSKQPVSSLKYQCFETNKLNGSSVTLVQRHVAGSRALHAPERRLPLSNRVAICLSRIEAEGGIHERVDTADGCVGRDSRGILC
ncbi:hypothetical protein CPBP_00629 [Candidatus Bodocaedibacter vickermanii]|uniref:Uncharacterized protein n=1 Tax=Candidatus Bodocaedibacter vickermanii TaxID=2741701 RepID=A0A7L9RU00_9PROT|nr:hypothetical protein CPBP_00629 [Candidatus Paracaedibacteraceae bacterium 'Lake Konstanz']